MFEYNLYSIYIAEKLYFIHIRSFFIIVIIKMMLQLISMMMKFILSFLLKLNSHQPLQVKTLSIDLVFKQFLA